jgi:hypothetical protein
LSYLPSDNGSVTLNVTRPGGSSWQSYTDALLNSSAPGDVTLGKQLQSVTEAIQEGRPIPRGTVDVSALRASIDTDAANWGRWSGLDGSLASLNPQNSADVGLYLWAKDRGLLQNDGPGFWSTLGSTIKSLGIGAGEVARNAILMGNAADGNIPTPDSQQQGEQAADRTMAEGLNGFNLLRATYQNLTAGTGSLVAKAAVAMGVSEAAKVGLADDPAVQARARFQIGQIDLTHDQRVEAINAKTAQTQAPLAALAQAAGASADQFSGASQLSSMVSDPANYLLPEAAGAIGRALSAGEAPVLGTAEAYRIKVAQLSATQADLAKQLALAAAGNAPADAHWLQDLTYAHANVSAELGAAQAGFDAANGQVKNWLRQYAPSYASRAVGATATTLGQTAENAGRFLQGVNDSWSKSITGLVGGSDAAPGLLKKFAAKTVPTAAAGYAVGRLEGGDNTSGLWGAGIGAALPEALTTAGTVSRSLGETAAIGRATMPFWTRFGQALTANGLPGYGKLATLADPFATAAADSGWFPSSFALAKRATYSAVNGAAGFLNDAAAGAARGIFPGAVLGYVGSGGDGSGASQGAGAAVAAHFVSPWGLVAGLGDAFHPVASAEDLAAMRAGSLRQLSFAWSQDPANLQRLASLPFTQQLDVASVFAANPDVSLVLLDNPADQSRVKAAFAGNPDQMPDLSNTPGFRMNMPDTGRAAIAINPRHPDWLAPIVAHEAAHEILARGGEDAVIQQVLGNPAMGAPGVATRIGADGTPDLNADGTYAVTPEFAAAKAEYQRRLAPLTSDNVALTDEAFALEYAAESAADLILKRAPDGTPIVDTSDYARPAVGDFVHDLVGRSQFVRNTLSKFGVALDPDGSGAVKGSLALPGLRHDPAVRSLLGGYVRDFEAGRLEREEPEEPTNVVLGRQAVLNNPSLLQTLFPSSPEVNWGPNGIPKGVEIINGKPTVVDESALFKSARQIDADQAGIRAAVEQAITNAKDVAGDPAAVKLLPPASDDVAAGRYFSPETIAALEASGKFNPNQIANLKGLNDFIRTKPGAFVRMLYQAATPGRGRYASLRAGWRSESPYMVRLTKEGNVEIRFLAYDKAADNLGRLWRKDPEKMNALWGSRVSAVADLHKYLTNLTEGKPGAEGLSDAKRDVLNLATGISTKGREAANPLFDESAKKLPILIRSRRLDRINRLTADDRTENFAWTPAAYELAKMNYTPGRVGAADAVPEPGDQQPTNLTNEQPNDTVPRDQDAEEPANVGSPAAQLPGAGEAPAPGSPPPTEGSFELPGDGAGRFAGALRAGSEAHPHGAAVDVKDESEYAKPGTRLFLAPDDSAGAAVTPDGDLVSVFKKPGSKVRISDILQEAAPHAQTLDAYAGNGFLPTLYSRFGFRPVARVPWSDAHAPAGWNYEAGGRPDVVFMVRDPDGKSGAPAIGRHYSELEEQVPRVSYEEAQALQRAALDRISNPPAEVATDPDNRGDDLAYRISTRVPTAVKATENPLTQQLTITGDQVKPNSADVAALLRRYPDLPAKGKAADVLQGFHDQAVSNLLWLHDQVPAAIRDRSRLWYDGGRKLVQNFSQQFEAPRHAVAAALAALSPQKDWYMNVDLARRVLAGRRELQGREVTPAVAEWFAGKFGEKNPEAAADLQAAVGKPFESLPAEQKAYFLRANDELNHARGYPIMSPEGDPVGPATNKDGAPSRVAWGDFGTIAKAISVLDDPSKANISARLGAEHKVRNFYNNLLLPNNAEHGDVTIDTHAVAAAHLRPLAGGDTPVAHNFGSGAPSSSLNGASGTYGLYADVYRDAAAQRGLLPREMQSITWEAVRGLFPAEFKTEANKAAVDQIWKQFKNGDVTIDEARNEIAALAGGIRKPSWAVSGP